MFPVAAEFPFMQLQLKTLMSFSEPGRPKHFLNSLSYFFISVLFASAVTESLAFEMSFDMDTKVDCRPTDNLEKKLPELSRDIN